jgi:XrtJ-associated TM-motif-TM protein
MKRILYFVFTVLAVLPLSSELYAQSGCVDSPEAPTAVLMVVGAIGMFYGSRKVLKLLRRGREN